jgi:uncharacterized SAM-binding protein YcdF (DUF218 family)
MTYTQPFFPLLLAALILAALLPSRFKRWIVVVLATTAFLFVWQPFASMAVSVLEHGYSDIPPSDRDAGAIVVLSSSVLPPATPREQTLLGSDTAERCWYGAWLHNHWQELPVIVSGGTGFADPAGTPISEIMARAVQAEGVPPSMIWKEDKSHSTYENALYTARLLRAKGISKIVLVTEAFHMLRAEQCFRKQGIQVIPAACAFRGRSAMHSQLLPGWQAILWNEDTLHETLGLAYYRMRSRI